MLVAALLLQDDPNAKVKEVLESDCALDFKDKKVNEMLQQLSEVQGVAFIADPRSVPAPDKLVCKAVKEGKLDEVLKELLAPHKLVFVAWEGAVIVATPAAAKEFEGGKVPIIGAKERGQKDAPAWKKTTYELLEKQVAIDPKATIRYGKQFKTTFAWCFTGIGETTGLRIVVDGTAKGACDADCNTQITSATAAVAIAILCRQSGCAAAMEDPKTIRIKR